MEDVRTELILLARLVVAGVLGGAIGWERLVAGKSAGVRTLALVASGSALFVGVAALALAEGVRGGLLSGPVESDPIRAVQAVALGIGFLGAGTVFVDRSRARVRGLTTAATIWATAALGIAVGLGRYVLSAGATLLVLFILRVVARMEPSEGD